jgi:hypothetical protein
MSLRNVLNTVSVIKGNQGPLNNLHAVSLHKLFAHARSIVIWMIVVLIMIIIGVSIEATIVSTIAIVEVFFVQIEAILFQDTDGAERFMIEMMILVSRIGRSITALLTLLPIDIEIHPWDPI